MGKVIQIKSTQSLADKLRALADSIDSGELAMSDNLTIISPPSIWQFTHRKIKDDGPLVGDFSYNTLWAQHHTMRAAHGDNE